MATSVKQVHAFDFHAKISKKVAELTVVVHMLFKRNHEKEVEYEYFKMMVEKELNKIKEEHRKKIEWLEKQLDEQETYRAKVEYQLGDLKDLEEKIRQLEQENEDTMHQLLEKEELLRVANLEIDVLMQKVQGHADNSNVMNREPEESPPNISLLEPTPVEQERISKSATQLHLPPSIPENQIEDLEAIIKGLEDEMTKLRNKHEKELSKSYSEKVMLQKKIDSYTSSLSQEIDELKQTLNTLSSKQMAEQKKISEMEREKRRLEDNLKKSEADKKQLQRDLKMLRDQLKNAVKSNQHDKKNFMGVRNAFSQSSPIESRDQELERLQREVQMYRRELENREGNFNRMFADKQPVIIGPQPEKFLIERNLTGTRSKRRNHLPKLQDQRSLTFVNGPNQTAYQL